MRLGRERGGRATRWQCRRVTVEEGVDRIAHAIGIDEVRAALPDGRTELLCEPGEARRTVEPSARRLQDRLPHGQKLECGKDGTHIAKGLMEGSDLIARGIPQLRAHRV